MKRTVTRALSIAATTAGCLCGLLPGTAIAGSYVVTACSPTSAPGPWAQTNTFPAVLTSGNRCGGPAIGALDGSHDGALYAEDVLGSGVNVPDGARAGWVLNAPSGTTISAISYYRSLHAYNDQDMLAGLFQADGSPLEQCKIPWPFISGSSIHCDKINDQAPVIFTGLNTSSLFLGVTCRIVTGALACIGGGTIHAASADLYSARVTLSEASAPTVTGVGGRAWGGGTISGVVPVTYAASDASGIQQQVVRGDAGQLLSSAPLPCDFTAAPPCPQQPAGVLAIDTRRVPDGTRSFSLTVTDPAGNSQRVTSPPVVVDNHPDAGVPGSNASTRTRIKAVIRGRRLRVSGTIVRSGRVRVSWRSKRAGRTVGLGSRTVRIRDKRIAVTFVLSPRARRGSTRVAVRSGSRIIAQARARRS